MSGLHWLWWPFKAFQHNKPTTTHFWAFLWSVAQLSSQRIPGGCWDTQLSNKEYKAATSISGTHAIPEHSCLNKTAGASQGAPSLLLRICLGFLSRIIITKTWGRGEHEQRGYPQSGILTSLRQPPTSLNASCLVIRIHSLKDQFLIHNPAHSFNQYRLRSSHTSGRVAAL